MRSENEGEEASDGNDADVGLVTDMIIRPLRDCQWEWSFGNLGSSVGPFSFCPVVSSA
jgi:hypothetical protein